MAKHRGRKDSIVEATYKDKLPETYYRKYDDINPVEVGNRIRQVRERNGLSQRNFAKELQISCALERKLESAEVYPNGRVMFFIHAMYGVDIQWLIYGTRTGSAEICDALLNADNQIRFDIFSRLYSFFETGNEDCLVFSKVPENTHFQDGKLFIRSLEKIIPQQEEQFVNKISNFNEGISKDKALEKLKELLDELL